MTEKPRIRTLHKKHCINCGEIFETTNISTLYCYKQECQEVKLSASYMPTPPAPNEDMKIGVIHNIMQEEKITYLQYANNRGFWIDRYYKRIPNDK